MNFGDVCDMLSMENFVRRNKIVEIMFLYLLTFCRDKKSTQRQETYGRKNYCSRLVYFKVPHLQALK